MTKAKIVLLVQGTLFQDGEPPFKKYQEGTGPLFVDHQAMGVTFGTPIEGGNESFGINASVSFPKPENPDNFFTDERYADLRINYRDKAYETLRLTGFAVDGIEAPGESGVVVTVLAREDSHLDLVSKTANNLGGTCFMDAKGVPRDYLHDCFARGQLYQFPDEAAAKLFASKVLPHQSGNLLLSLYERVA